MLAKKKHTINKKERLKSRKSIDALFLGGSRFGIAPFKVFYQFTEQDLRFGVGVSQRNFKKATDRNRVKRLIREVYRLQKNGLAASLSAKKKGVNLFFIYVDKELPEYITLFTKMEKAIQKILSIANENTFKGA